VVKEEFLCNEDHLNVINLELPSPASVGLSFARLKKAVSELAFIIPNDRENWIPVRKTAPPSTSPRAHGLFICGVLVAAINDRP
jgi:hypothetical protein